MNKRIEMELHKVSCRTCGAEIEYDLSEAKITRTIVNYEWMDKIHPIPRVEEFITEHINKGHEIIHEHHIPLD